MFLNERRDSQTGKDNYYGGNLRVRVLYSVIQALALALVLLLLLPLLITGTILRIRQTNARYYHPGPQVPSFQETKYLKQYE